jgi:hypothetical protein
MGFHPGFSLHQDGNDNDQGDDQPHDDDPIRGADL